MNAKQLMRMSMIAMIAVAIGCGGSKEQATAASTDTAAAPAAAAGGATGSAAVTGEVSFKGSAPAATTIKMDADPVCQMQHGSGMTSDEVMADGGRLANVFVYVKTGLEGDTFPAPSSPVTLDQHGCWYQPHVLGIQVGQSLEIVNSDGTLHNINVKPTANAPFNVAQPMQGMKTTKKFTKPEVMIKTKCNVHPWMSAYIGVVAHPFFAVTGKDGAFSLAGLPAGTYTVEAWHEKFGTKTQSVTVADGATQAITFEFP